MLSVIPATGSAATGTRYTVVDRLGPGVFVYALELAPQSGEALRQGQIEVAVQAAPAPHQLHLSLVERP